MQSGFSALALLCGLWTLHLDGWRADVQAVPGGTRTCIVRDATALCADRVPVAWRAATAGLPRIASSGA